MPATFLRMLPLLSVAFLATATIAPGQTAGRRHKPKSPAPVAASFPWSQLAGMPTIAPGRGVGYFIFREGNVVRIVTTNLGNKGRKFVAGVVLEGGTLDDARTLKLERRQDAIKRLAPNHLRFQFITYGATDGIQFTVNQGTQLRINLELGKLRPEDCIFLGGSPTAAVGNPVFIELGA